jgi:hypothetical protein
MRDGALQVAGLSGDLGWNEADDIPMRGVSTVLMVIASGVVWGSVWLLSGFPPLWSVARLAQAGDGKGRGQQV